MAPAVWEDLLCITMMKPQDGTAVVGGELALNPKPLCLRLDLRPDFLYYRPRMKGQELASTDIWWARITRPIQLQHGEDTNPSNRTERSSHALLCSGYPTHGFLSNSRQAPSYDCVNIHTSRHPIDSVPSTAA